MIRKTIFFPVTDFQDIFYVLRMLLAYVLSNSMESENMDSKKPTFHFNGNVGFFEKDCKTD